MFTLIKESDTTVRIEIELITGKTNSELLEIAKAEIPYLHKYCYNKHVKLIGDFPSFIILHIAHYLTHLTRTISLWVENEYLVCIDHEDTTVIVPDINVIITRNIQDNINFTFKKGTTLNITFLLQSLGIPIPIVTFNIRGSIYKTIDKKIEGVICNIINSEQGSVLLYMDSTISSKLELGEYFWNIETYNEEQNIRLLYGTMLLVDHI